MNTPTRTDTPHTTTPHALSHDMTHTTPTSPRPRHQPQQQTYGTTPPAQHTTPQTAPPHHHPHNTARHHTTTRTRAFRVAQQRVPRLAELEPSHRVRPREERGGPTSSETTRRTTRGGPTNRARSTQIGTPRARSESRGGPTEDGCQSLGLQHKVGSGPTTSTATTPPC